MYICYVYINMGWIYSGVYASKDLHSTYRREYTPCFGVYVQLGLSFRACFLFINAMRFGKSRVHSGQLAAPYG